MTSNAEYVSQIRQCLEERKITIRDLSHRTGIPYRTLQNYLSECRKMPLANFSIIAKAIGLPSLGEQSRPATGEEFADKGSDFGSAHRQPVEDVIGRLKAILNVTTDTEFTQALGIPRSTVASWRSRDAIPFRVCVDIAQKTGASLDFIILGRTGTLPLISSAGEAKSSSEAAETNRTEHTGLGDIDMAVLFSAALSKFGVPRLIDIDEGPLFPSGYKIKAEITLQMLPPENASPAPDKE